MRSWNRSISTKAGSCVEVTLLMMMQARTLYSQSRVRLHLQWRPQKWWMALQGCPIVQDKQPTQYEIRAEWMWRTLQNFETKFRSPNYIWIRLPRHKWPKSWSNIECFVVLLERNLYGHPFAGFLWERHFVKVLLELKWENVPNRRMSICSPKTTIILIVLRGRQQWLEESRIWALCGRIWWSGSNLENQRHFLIMYIWDVLNVNANLT